MTRHFIRSARDLIVLRDKSLVDFVCRYPPRNEAELKFQSEAQSSYRRLLSDETPIDRDHHTLKAVLPQCVPLILRAVSSPLPSFPILLLTNQSAQNFTQFQCERSDAFTAICAALLNLRLTQQPKMGREVPSFDMRGLWEQYEKLKAVMIYICSYCLAPELSVGHFVIRLKRINETMTLEDITTREHRLLAPLLIPPEEGTSLIPPNDQSENEFAHTIEKQTNVPQTQMSQCPRTMSQSDSESEKREVSLHKSPKPETMTPSGLHGVEDVGEAYKFDFANRSVGGAVLGRGLAQEEILFITHPELLISLIVCPKLRDREAVIATGVRRFTRYSGYMKTFKVTGGRFVNRGDAQTHRDANRGDTQRDGDAKRGDGDGMKVGEGDPHKPTRATENTAPVLVKEEELNESHERDGGRLGKEDLTVAEKENDGDTFERAAGGGGQGDMETFSDFLIADARRFGREEFELQFDAFAILREYVKICAAISGEDDHERVATGNWGCGCFGGDAVLKFLIQWCAFSAHKKQIIYLTFDPEIHTLISHCVSTLSRTHTTTETLMDDLLLRCHDKKPGRINRHFINLLANRPEPQLTPKKRHRDH